MKTPIKELINILKYHRDTSYEKMKEYPDESLFYEGRADGFELTIHILELAEEKECYTQKKNKKLCEEANYTMKPLETTT